MPRKKKQATRELPRGYGYVQEIQTEPAAKVQARWKDGERWRAKTFTAPTLDEARDMANDHLVAMRRARRDGRPVTPSLMTVADLVDVYIERQRASWSGWTEVSNRKHYRNYILPALGDVRLTNLSKADVQHFIDHLVRRLQATSVRQVVGLLRAACNHAVDLEIIPKSPAAGTKCPQVQRTKHQVWSVSDTSRMLQAIADDPYLDAFYRLTLGTGLRPGEIRGLQWDDLDLTGGSITIRRTATVDRDGQAIVGDRTKTGRDRRIALAPGIVAALITWRQRQAEFLQEAPRRQMRPFVFSERADGSMPAYTVLRKRHEHAIQRAHVPRITLHELRHTFATIAIETGALNPLVASLVLGHSNVRMTLDTYTHPSTSMQTMSLHALEHLVTGNVGTQTDETEGQAASSSG